MVDSMMLQVDMLNSEKKCQKKIEREFYAASVDSLDTLSDILIKQIVLLS